MMRLLMPCCFSALSCWRLITPKTTWMALYPVCKLHTPPHTHTHTHTHIHTQTCKHAGTCTCLLSSGSTHSPSSFSYCVCMCVCVHACVRVCLGRGDISCITYHRLFDLPSFIFSAKKPDITGSLSTLLSLHFKP